MSSGNQSNGILTIKEWDNSSIKQRNKLLKDFHERYTCDGIDGYDIERMEDELNQDIVLLISRIVAGLEIMIQKSYSLHFYICTLCALITTGEGQIFAETSPNIIAVLIQCLQFDIKSKEDDLLISLIMVRRSCIFNEKLRAALVSRQGIDIVGSILQQNETSPKIQEAACALLLDLSTLNQNTSASLSNILRSLFNTPFLLTKHAAMKIISSILITASPVVVSYSNWEHEFIVQMTRLLICAPLQYQYDASELISMLFESENEIVRNGLMSVVSGLLCVRYTLGGTSIVDPPQQWEYLFPLHDQSPHISEVPEILVSVIVMSALSSLDDIDLNNISTNVTHLKAKFDILTTHMRTSKLHRNRALLSHILWYVREKTVLHKVLSIWVDRTELNLQSTDPDHHKTKFRKVAKVARQWIQRKSSVSGANLRSSTPPELRRASILLKSSSEVAPTVNDTEATSQDLACINCIRVLQKWLELDCVAHEDVVYDFSHLGYERQIAYICLENGTEVIDLLPTLSNIVRYVKANGSENQQVGKNSFFSTYLSQLVTPGELVKSLKVNLSNALQYDMGSVYPTNLSLSASSSTSYSENIGGFPNQDSVYDTSFMPPSLQSAHSKSESSVTIDHHSSHSQPTEIEPLHSLPSPPIENRHHRPSVREKRSNSNFYTKQYSGTAEPHLESPLKVSGVIGSADSPRMILRDGPSKSNCGDKSIGLTPQDRLTLSTSTPQKPGKLGELKPSPPKGLPSSDGSHPSPESHDGVSPGKGRFVRQSLLRQRSSMAADTADPGQETKNTQRLSIIGGIQHGGYTQPTPPSTNHSTIRPHSRGRIAKTSTEPVDIDELNDSEDNLSTAAVANPDDHEQKRIQHLNSVVNQLLADEENLLAELESHNIALSSTIPLMTKKFPLSDPLVPHNSPKSRSFPTHHQSTMFPDPNNKLKTSSYNAAISNRKEKDQMILQSLANPDTPNFAETTNGKSVGSRHQRDSNEENRTYFPGIY